MEIKFYAACLTAYNAGRLHGRWIVATADAESMAEEVNAMLAASPMVDAEEWLVHDWNDPSGALSTMGETSDLKGIAERVEAVEDIEGIVSEFDECLIPHLVEWVADQGVEPYNWKSHLEDAFGGEWTDAEDYAASLCEDTVGGIPTWLQGYIEYRWMARDMALNGEVDFICTSTGRHLQSFEDMRGRSVLVLRCC